MNRFFLSLCCCLSLLVGTVYALYEKCSANEFEFNSVKAEYTKQLEDMRNNFDFASIYYINNQVVIGKYDFCRIINEK
ncbi:MAG: DUF4852 domain-containing protein [Bacteroidales bacterium]|nr:DUF4852 domain-containing protein [Bacteroidales bacterium]